MADDFDITNVQVSDAPPGSQWVDEGDISIPGADAAPETKADFVRSISDRSRRRREARAAEPIPPKPKSGTLVKPLQDLYASIGMMVIPFDQVCGTAIVNSAPACAEALENAARENPQLRKIILRLIETSVWGQLVAAHAPIVMTIAAHHVPKIQQGMTPVDPEMNGHVS